MTVIDFKLLTAFSWNEKNQPLTIDVTKDKDTGRYPLGLNSLIIPHSSPFRTLHMIFYPHITEQDLIKSVKFAQQQKSESGKK